MREPVDWEEGGGREEGRESDPEYNGSTLAQRRYTWELVIRA